MKAVSSEEEERLHGFFRLGLGMPTYMMLDWLSILSWMTKSDIY